MEENNKLALSNTTNLVVRVSTTVSITNKLIAENNRQLVLEIFERNPKLFIQLISKYYPLSKETITVNIKIWDWRFLSCNKAINKNIDFIDNFFSYLDWTLLIRNLDFEIHLSFIEKYINQINLYDINPDCLVWDNNLLSLYEKHNISYNWKNLFSYKKSLLEVTLNESTYKKFIDKENDSTVLFKSINIDINFFDKCKDVIAWKTISGLKNIDWSKKLIDRYIKYWDWNVLSSNPAIRFNDWLENYKNYINYFYLTSNESFDITTIFLKENKNKELNWHSISSNENIKWDIETISLFEEKIKWFYFSSKYYFSKDMIVKFDNFINFKNLSNNKNVIFDYEIIKRYEDKLHFYYLSWRNDIIWNEKLITDFSEKWDWPNLSNNENIQFTKELINKFENKLLFNFNDNNPDSFYGSYFGASIYGLSSNKNTVWSIALIENYIDRWNWEELSGNINLPWTLELIEKYNNKWDWNNLSYNSKLAWSEDLIQKYEDKWNWSKLSSNENLPWTIELLKKYEDKWDYYYLSKNKNIIWSLTLLHKHSEKLESSKTIWNILQPFIDDEMVIQIIKNNKNQKKI